MPDPKLLPDFVYGSTTYVVEKLVETDDILKERLEAPTLDFGARYILRGPLGAEYCLVPNQPNPTLFFAVNAKSFLKGTPFDGKLFTERGGRLVLAWPWTRKLLVGLIALAFVLVLALTLSFMR